MSVLKTSFSFFIEEMNSDPSMLHGKKDRKRKEKKEGVRIGKVIKNIGADERDAKLVS